MFHPDGGQYCSGECNRNKSSYMKTSLDHRAGHQPHQQYHSLLINSWNRLLRKLGERLSPVNWSTRWLRMQIHDLLKSLWYTFSPAPTCRFSTPVRHHFLQTHKSTWTLSDLVAYLVWWLPMGSTIFHNTSLPRTPAWLSTSQDRALIASLDNLLLCLSIFIVKISS